MDNNRGKLSAKVVGQISLIQGYVSILPNLKSILEFVTRGLDDIPGLDSVTFSLPLIGDKSFKPKEEGSIKVIPIQNRDIIYAYLTFKISNTQNFSPYLPYIENLTNMLAIVIDGINQRKINEELLLSLEAKVEERTEELSAEIDENIRVNELLSISNEKTNTILKSIGDGVIAADENGKVIMMNPVAEQLTGYSFYESEGKLLRDIFKVTREYKDSDGILLDGIESRSLVLINKSGNRIYISNSIADIDGSSRGIVVVFRDVSEEFEVNKKKSEKFRRMQAQQNALIELRELEGIITLDMVSHIKGLNEIISKALNVEQVSFWTFDDSSKGLLCKDIYTLSNDLHREGSSVVEQIIYEYFKVHRSQFLFITHDSINCELFVNIKESYLLRNNITSLVNVLIKIDGEPYGVISMEHIGVKRFWEDDEVTFIKAISSDLTQYLLIMQHRAMENQLIQSQKMDAIGQLAGGIAHDFNNMLGGILGSTQYLLTSKRNLDEKSVKFIKLIDETARKAAGLTSKLLLYSRKNEKLSTLVDVHNSIDEALVLLKRTIDKKIIIDSKLEAKKSRIVGDDAQIESLIINMIINSSHAMVDGGVIEIITRNVFLDKQYCMYSSFGIEMGDYIEIEIRDQGCGIPRENVTRIFEPFFTTKEQGKGTGLGLSAVYGVIQSHKGAINVYSEVNIGTVFHIYLPLSEHSVVRNMKESNVKLGSGTILLIDDEEIIRITATALLEELGYTVILAENGALGLELYKKNRSTIDVVLLDMIMPVMSGKEAFEKIRSIDPYAKIILSSGFSKEGDFKVLHENGLSGFIKKPYRREELSTIIHNVIGE